MQQQLLSLSHTTVLPFSDNHHAILKGCHETHVQNQIQIPLTVHRIMCENNIACCIGAASSCVALAEDFVS
jgi:hypothetical protein